jgi:hypothetical protein
VRHTNHLFTLIGYRACVADISQDAKVKSSVRPAKLWAPHFDAMPLPMKLIGYSLHPCLHPSDLEPSPWNMATRQQYPQASPHFLRSMPFTTSKSDSHSLSPSELTCLLAWSLP